MAQIVTSGLQVIEKEHPSRVQGFLGYGLIVTAQLNKTIRQGPLDKITQG